MAKPSAIAIIETAKSDNGAEIPYGFTLASLSEYALSGGIVSLVVHGDGGHSWRYDMPADWGEWGHIGAEIVITGMSGRDLARQAGKAVAAVRRNGGKFVYLTR